MWEKITDGVTMVDKEVVGKSKDSISKGEQTW